MSRLPTAGQYTPLPTHPPDTVPHPPGMSPLSTSSFNNQLQSQHHSHLSMQSHSVDSDHKPAASNESVSANTSTNTHSTATTTITPPKKNLILDMALGGIASAIAGVVSNPFELVKTRFQLQRELSKGEIIYTSILDCIKKIIKYEGFFGIQNGLGSAIAYQLVMNSTRLGCFEYATNLDSLKDINADSNPTLNLVKNFLLGSLCGGFGAWIGAPIFVIKTRLQIGNKARHTHPHMAIGEQYGYTGLFDGLKRVYQQGGLKLLYRNSTLSAQRVFFGSGFQLSSYDQIKYHLSTQANLSGTPLHLLSSAASSFVVTIAMNPFDLVLSRVNNQNINAPLKYTGAIDCFQKVLKTEGLGGFYKGFWSHYARLAPHGIVTFMTYEQMKLKFKGKSSRELALQSRQQAAKARTD